MKVLTSFRGPRYLVPCIALVLFFHRASTVSAQDISVVGTQQQTNDKIHSMGEASKLAAPHEYTIGNGDLLSLSVFDVPELSKDVRVNQNGTISIPLVPTRLHVAGLTELQAEQLIADVLEANGLVSHAEVAVSVKEHRSRPITIVGAVMHPMVYETDHSATLLEALAEAGGVSNDAADTIIVTRTRAATFIPVPTPPAQAEPAPGAGTPSETTPPSTEKAQDSPEAKPGVADLQVQDSTTTAESQATPSGNLITINLNDLLETGDTKNNITLQAGDVVTVPHAGIVYVLGAVSRPGGYVVANDRAQLTTMKVLSLAGGNTRTAKLDHAVIIRKDRQGKQSETSIDLKKVLSLQSEDLQMRASDVLYIPEDRTKAALIQAAQIALAVGTAVAIYRLAYH